MKSITVSVTENTEQLVKNATLVSFEKRVKGTRYDFNGISFGNTTHCYRVNTLLALGTINPKSKPAEFELLILNGEKFDSHIHSNFKKLGARKK